ncbi:hypothetical protein M011DRAFT_472047 [Sporormia fimetaria CBS 119925]|uniref:Uncharacterized protein n=1 Tax=Sporormia fimetaria CBS 119925 TaxID=1340428 RepID=A0A6A6UWR0_9PLEO|nr:hypothetical protein M011DRAFT_472047 [Sporormia fimetaria CBS 119925]
MYGLWKAYSENNVVDNIRYVMLVQITNELTKALIVRALGDIQIDSWPGTFIGMGNGEVDEWSPAGLALLGSPVARSLAYMLIQHKEAFKGLRIVGARVFPSNNRIRKACVLWYLKGPAPGVPA